MWLKTPPYPRFSTYPNAHKEETIDLEVREPACDVRRWSAYLPSVLTVNYRSNNALKSFTILSIMSLEALPVGYLTISPEV